MSFSLIVSLYLLLFRIEHLDQRLRQIPDFAVCRSNEKKETKKEIKNQNIEKGIRRIFHQVGYPRIRIGGTWIL